MVEEGRWKRSRTRSGRNTDGKRRRPGGPGIRERHRLSGDLRRYLDGELTLSETAGQIAAATRRYARRQLTWLRKLRDAVIMDVQDRDPEDIAGEILSLALALAEADRVGVSDIDEAGQVAWVGQRLPGRRGVRPSRPL